MKKRLGSGAKKYYNGMWVEDVPWGMIRNFEGEFCDKGLK